MFGYSVENKQKTEEAFQRATFEEAKEGESGYWGKSKI
jgi:hypothetical protein